MRIPKVILSLYLLSVVPVFSGPGTASDNARNSADSIRKMIRFYVGVNGAIALNQHMASFGQLPGIPSCCGTYGDASASTFSASAVLDIPVVNRYFHIQFRPGFTFLNGMPSNRESIGNEPVYTGGPVPTERRTTVETEHTLAATLPLLFTEVAGSYTFLERLWVHGGMRVGYLLNPSVEQKEVLLSPEGYVFADTRTGVRNVYNGDIPDVNAIQLHGIIGAAYTLPLGATTALLPELRFYIPITKITSVSWSIASIQLGATLRFAILRPREPVIIRDTIWHRDTTVVAIASLRQEEVVMTNRTQGESQQRVEDVITITTSITETFEKRLPRIFEPDISLAIRTLSGNAVSVITLRETDVIESYPILPIVYFPEGSADLDSSSIAVLSPADAAQFSTKSLQRNQLDVYNNMLNMIGIRMKQIGAGSITLTGCVNNTGVEKENRPLARSRAEAVRDYLINVWTIDPSRIVVRDRLLPASPASSAYAEGREENQRVDISASDPQILEPVEFRDTDRTVDPGKIRIAPMVKSDQEVQRWTMDVKQNQRGLLSASGREMTDETEWETESDPRPSTDEPVEITYTVENDAGQKKTIKQRIPVEIITTQLAKARREEGRLVERYSLIVFDYNSAQLNSANQKIVERVKARIQPNSKVTISGYADRTGESGYNRDLAARRCREVQRILSIPNDQVTIDAVGSDRLIYDNDTPIGRAYSRTVQIEIETPLK